MALFQLSNIDTAGIIPPEEIYSERISLVFQRLRVVRVVDAPRNTLVYLTYSDRVIEGSPQKEHHHPVEAVVARSPAVATAPRGSAAVGTPHWREMWAS